MLHRIIVSEGDQPLKHVPRSQKPFPLRVSALSSVLFRIEDMRESLGGTGRVIASGTPTDDSSTTTLTTAIAGRNQTDQQRIAVVSAAGFAQGRTYIIDDGDNSELFQAKSADASSNIIEASAPLTSEYASGAAVEGVTLEATFPASEADDVGKLENSSTGGPYQVTWIYTVDTQILLVPEQVLVTRYSVQPWVTEDEIVEWDPTWATRANGDRGDILKALVRATEHFEMKLEETGRNPAQWRNTRAGGNAVKLKTTELLYAWVGSDRDDAMSRDIRDEYRAAVTSILAGNEPFGATTSPQPTDQTNDGRSAHYGKRYFVRA